MANFKLFWPLLSRNEGGYVSEEEAAKKHDSGGETYEGISRNNYPAWPGWALLDSYKPQATFPAILTRDHTLQDMVLSFYKKTQWDVMDGDLINNQSIANLLADWGVNGGMTVPIKHAEGDVHVTVDGKMGPITVGSINATDQEALFNELKSERIQFYHDVVKAHPEDEGLLEGWLARTNRFTFTA